jgi:Fe-S cluster assembly protein SufD
MDSSSSAVKPAWVEKNFAAFEQVLNGGSKLPLHSKRKAALSNFIKTGFPTSSLEEWKYTNPQPIADTLFSLINTPGVVSDINKFTTIGLDSYKFVFIDGIFNSSLSASSFEAGLEVTNIKSAQKPEAQLSALVNNNLGSVADQNDAFVAINTAFVNDGVVISVAKNAHIKTPVELVFVSTKSAQNAAIQPRIYINCEQGGNVTVVERYVSEDNSTCYLSNSVFECQVAKNASVDHYRLQDESLAAYHVSTIQAALENDANFRTHTFSFGSKLARNSVNVVMNGSNCNTTMNGLSVLSADQHVDNATLLDHAKPHCESLELYKGIYDGKSQGVFSGTIIVREDAQKTNAVQSNRSMLLSEDAQVNTKPQLKIWADDVKCTHGATIGQMDEDALFYIKSRGVSDRDAKVMLVHAFASEITNCVKLESLASEIQQKLVEKLSLKAA